MNTELRDAKMPDPSLAAQVYDAIVVGAGQAGLGMSYFLKQAGLNHLVLERGQIGETWLAQRWETFKLNTPNQLNTLPGLPYDGAEPEGFWDVHELLAYFRRYIDHFNLPVRTDVTVRAVEREEGSGYFQVRLQPAGQPEQTLIARSVVVAAGAQREPKIPGFHHRLPAWLTQLHTADYSSPETLPPGAVVVVGCGQSGVQVAEELLLAGRKVYLCTSRVGRAPRRYRGRDILPWLRDINFLDATLESLPDPKMAQEATPQVSGLGRLGHTVSLQYLHSLGAEILGRLHDVQGESLVIGDDAAANVRYGDAVSQRMKDSIDAYLVQRGVEPQPLEEDPADLPDPQASCASPLHSLDLKAAQVSTLIWATGFRGNFPWVHLPAFDADGQPVHRRGVSPVEGLYFIGLPWLTSRKSGILLGIEDDAAYIAGQVLAQTTRSERAVPGV